LALPSREMERRGKKHSRVSTHQAVRRTQGLATEAERSHPKAHCQKTWGEKRDEERQASKQKDRYTNPQTSQLELDKREIGENEISGNRERRNRL